MKSHSTHSVLAILCMVFLVAGCASLEPTYNKTYDQLEVGMSEQRVLNLMGPPMTRNTSAVGPDQWVYRAGLDHRMRYGELQRLVQVYTKNAGLRPERDVSMHDMRHTWFSWLLNDLGLARKVPAISKMGGHSNIERTWKYVRVGSEAGRDAVYESLDLTSPSGREDEVRAWLTRAPVMHQTDPAPQRSSTPADLGL